MRNDSSAVQRNAGKCLLPFFWSSSWSSEILPERTLSVDTKIDSLSFTAHAQINLYVFLVDMPDDRPCLDALICLNTVRRHSWCLFMEVQSVEPPYVARGVCRLVWYSPWRINFFHIVSHSVGSTHRKHVSYPCAFVRDGQERRQLHTSRFRRLVRGVFSSTLV